MPEYLNTSVMLAFEDELKKQAFLGGALGKAMSRNVAGMGAGIGLGGVGGGLTGAGVGAYQGYQGTEEEGGGVGGALSGAFKGLGRGAAAGAVGGAALGAGGGRASRALARVAEGSGGGLMPSAIARFGQRQLHGATGLVPGGALRLLPGGNVNSEYMASMKGMRMGGKKVSPEEEMAAAQGLTNLPGLAKRVLQKGGLGDVYRAGFKPLITKPGVSGKMMAALPVIGAATEAAQPGEVEGKTYGQRIGGAAGMGLGYAAVPFMPLVGAEAVSRGLSAAGGTVGKGIDKLMGVAQKRKENPLGQTPGAPSVEDGARQSHVEREYTDRAMGKSPDIGIGGL